MSPGIEYVVVLNCNPTCQSSDEYVAPTPSPTPSPTDTPVTGVASNIVYSSLFNGPFYSARHSWAWPSTGKTCNFTSSANSWPCGIDEKLLDRTLKFESSYIDFKIEIDNGLKATLALGDSASQGGTVNDTLSFYPSSFNTANAVVCASPPSADNYAAYPIRLVRSGSYLHHWYINQIQCDTSSARMEIKVTNDW
jgi:hypothetical protein